MNKPLTALAVLLLIGSLAAESWLDDGHGGVYWTMNNYTISAYPKTANSTGTSFTQYVNFTSTNPQSILVNLSFVFNEQPISGDIKLWQNTSHTVPIQYQGRLNLTFNLTNVTANASSTAACQIGDAQNALKRRFTYTSNGTQTIIVCYNSYNRTGSSYIFNYTANGTVYTTEQQYWMDWSSILNSFTYTNIAEHHVYTINNVPFDGSTNYQTKFDYSFQPIVSITNGQATEKIYSGKFDIYAHSGSPSDVVSGIGTTYVVLDPYYNSTGGSVTTDGAYTVVTYTTNGTFNVTGEINASVLVVGGGGAGYDFAGGGGGGGGIQYNTSFNATGIINVTIGAGGNCGFTYCTFATGNGKNSTFGTITAIGGGYGGTYDKPPTIGGSGGGGGRALSGTTGAAGIAGQGSAGGNGASDNCGGGGGGNNATGSSCDGTNGGAGGAGTNYTINGSTVCYGGGAGGGSRAGTPATGKCGGGTGDTAGTPSANANGTNGLGGGGGAGNGPTRGGSGIVIIRYLTYSAISVNITCLIQTKTDQYNGTMVNYTLMGIFHNPTALLQTVNLSITANGTSVATNNSVAIAAGGLATLTGNYTKARGSLDMNFTVNASATGSDQSDLNGSSSSTVFLILPIDPPSAINLMNNGGKTRCRTPQDIGYWDGRNWSINASWNCNYTNLNLTSTTATATTKGTYASFLHDDGFTDADNASDGSYTTKTTYTSFASNSTYWNYTNPANSLNQTTWQVKHGKSATYNITLASQYANQATIMVKITSNNSNSTAGNAASSAKTTTTWASSAGIGNVAWTNPDRAQAQDTSYATAVLAFNASAHNRTVYLNGSGWGFAIPTDAVITGVLVDIRRNVSSVASSRITMDNSVRLQVAGAAAGDDEATTTQYTTAWATASYGGATNLATTWNTALTPASVNAANFGILFSAKATGSTSTRTVNVDFINMTVFYNTSSNFSQSSAYAYNGTAWVKVGTDSTGTNDYTASDIYEQDMYFNSTAASGNIAGAGIKFVDSGTTTFSNSNITVSVFDRLVGDLGTAAIFVFQQASNLLIK
jgi:hypothetical protein